MKRWAIALLFLTISSYISATTITTSQPIRDPRGNRLNGRIVFYLPAPAVNTSTQAVLTSVAPPVIVNNGLLVGTVTLVGNDIISPKMYYSANYYDSSGRWLSTYRYYISGSSFDLGSAPMTPVTTSNISTPGFVQGTGTVNRLTKWLNGTLSQIQDSSFLDDGTNASTTEPFTTPKINGIFQVGSGPGQYTTIQACLNAIPTATYGTCTTTPNLAGGTCWISGGGVCTTPPGYTETLTADLTLTHDKKLIMYPPAVVNTNGFKVKCDMALINSVACSGAGIENPVWNNHNEASSGVVFNGGSGQTGNLFDLGDGISGIQTMAFRNLQIHCIDCNLAANALSLNKVSESVFENLDLVVSQNAANTGKCLVTTGGFDNRFIHLIPNFCNTAISQGDSNDEFQGFANGNANTLAGSVYMSVTGSGNKVRATKSFSGSYATMFTTSGNGNEYDVGHMAGTTDFAFTGTADKNIALCPGGACVVSDTSSGLNSAWGDKFQLTNSGDMSMRRLRPLQGTALVAGDFALSAGWGNTATVSTIVGTDTAFVVIVTANGAGIAANPTLTLTLKDGTIGGGGTVPMCGRGDINAPTAATWNGTATGSTAPVFTFVGLPVAGTTYQANCLIVGR